MAKIFQIEDGYHDRLISAHPAFREREETAAQIVALMQAKFSRPNPQEMLEILHCSADQIFHEGH